MTSRCRPIRNDVLRWGRSWWNLLLRWQHVSVTYFNDVICSCHVLVQSLFGRQHSRYPELYWPGHDTLTWGGGGCGATSVWMRPHCRWCIGTWQTKVEVVVLVQPLFGLIINAAMPSVVTWRWYNGQTEVGVPLVGLAMIAWPQSCAAIILYGKMYIHWHIAASVSLYRPFFLFGT